MELVTWQSFLSVVIAADLSINFFFHLVELKRYCEHQNALRSLAEHTGRVEHKLNRLKKDFGEYSSERTFRGVQTEKEDLETS